MLTHQHSESYTELIICSMMLLTYEWEFYLLGPRSQLINSLNVLHFIQANNPSINDGVSLAYILRLASSMDYEVSPPFIYIFLPV